jgi:methionyl-tRNA formyltransferase
MGTAEFAVPTLKRLVSEGYSISAVVTQPDKPSGRGQSFHASPVKRAALELHLSVHQPATLKDAEARRLFENLQPACLIVVAYGRILPLWLIQLPQFGALNLHGSLLPKYRGAAPIQWAVANGETETGVCTMRIDEGLDTGPVYLCEKTTIQPDETIAQLSARLSNLGSELTIRTLEGIVAGSVRATPQDHSKASLAPMIQKADGVIHWDADAQTIHNRIRAFNPWPGTVTQFRGVACRILKSRVGQPVEGKSTPGRISVLKGIVTVECGDGFQLELVEVQMPSRKPVSGSDFANGMRVRTGDLFQQEDGPQS